MKISEIMSVNSVMLSLKAGSKRQLLQELARKASELTGINERTVFDTILERENLGSTGFGGGTALPHGRLSELNKVCGIFARLSTAIDFDAVDNKPVDTVFLLLSPESSGADHLTALAQISRVLKDENTCTKLRAAKSNEEVYALLNN
ncbi:MAG: PTS IIA-like nitrogen regulatory protein PtsN [Alphaproteobacteria bacterium]|nr:PTS IIA-like nitrogen regulatory protein PtsN [Alphaproteobacteria bacterium]